MNCPKGNAVLPSNAISCPYCSCRFGTLNYQNDAEDELVGYLIPIHASMLSVLAGYLGLFAVLVFPAPIALIFGIIALRDINKRQARGEKTGGKGRAVFAIIMGGFFTLICILVLMASIMGK
jgi:hypothetical protein